MEENRRFNWSDLFIKIILVIIFILFTVWLLSLSNRKMTNSLEVLTDEIFVNNMQRMKEVGKDYFTTERLPQKVGEVEILTLKKMYQENYILELKDKNGSSCSAENSYVSIEKFDNEYQMKVFLECGERSEYIIVIMGCYDYCDSDICEKEEVVEEEYIKGETPTIEYEYKKTTNGSWTEYGPWSEWSKVSVTNTDYRQIETKIVKEEYTYDKVITETDFIEISVSCPDGYKLTSDGTKCYKENTVTLTEDAVCPSVSGYTLVGRDGFTCNYSKSTTSSVVPSCPSVSGYELIGRDGFTCSYSKTTSSSVEPSCPSVSGYTLVGRDRFTCNYIKTTSSSAEPSCPSVSGYTLVGRDGFTCNYSKTSTSSADPVCPSKSGWSVSRSGFTCNYSRTVSVPYTETVTVSKTCYSQKTYKPCASCAPVVQSVPYDCSSTSTVTKYKDKTETDTATAICPSGYSKSGSSCVKSTTDTTTKTASCPSGYSKSGNSCVKSTTDTTTKTASCPSGYNKSGNNCINSTTDTTTKTASCPSGYSKSGNNCIKQQVNKVYDYIIMSCPSDYKMTSDYTKCYKEIDKVVQKTEVREVVYYRYRIREYVGGSVDYKWSTSKNDTKLLNAGYKLTGRTR